MVIAIDGPAGTGKSTVASRVAKSLNFTFLNSGSFYRAVALAACERGTSFDDAAALTNLAENLDLSYKDACVFSEGKNVESLLHTAQIDNVASKVSAIPAVRHAVNRKINAAVKGLSIVCEGRDMTTVVFPQAECKIYLDASLDVQTQRRYLQYREKGENVDFEDLKAQIIERDKRDREKPEGALKIAPDALVIDTSDLDIDEVCEKIISHYKRIVYGRVEA